MLNFMVKYSNAPLDRIFGALADPTRRALLARLAEQPDLSISALAAPFAVSLPAIMKHLDVLSDAGLVARKKSGRTVACRLKAAPMQEAAAWLNRYERFWSEALARLSDYLEQDSLEEALEEEESCPSQPQSSPVSPSSGTSKHHRRKSSRHGPTRKK
jgi:DNA-binding transcriptional ArsR family regulator